MSRGLFRILGPVMVGPSSSHTAGAVRIGNIARTVCKGKAKKIKFYLHGSFRNTYKGHGTDRALAAGILGFKTDDERIIYSLELAREKGLSLEFIKADLGDVHPNTVKIEMFDENNEKTSIVASSIGGGEIRVYSINGLKVNTSCIYNSTIIEHITDIYTTCLIVNLIKKYNLDLISMSLVRQKKTKNQSITMLEINNETKEITCLLEELRLYKSVLKITYIEKI